MTNLCLSYFLNFESEKEKDTILIFSKSVKIESDSGVENDSSEEKINLDFYNNDILQYLVIDVDFSIYPYQSKDDYKILIYPFHKNIVGYYVNRGISISFNFEIENELSEKSLLKLKEFFGNIALKTFKKIINTFLKNTIKINHLIELFPNISEIRDIYNKSKKCTIEIQPAMAKVIFEDEKNKHIFKFSGYDLPIIRYIIYPDYISEKVSEILYLKDGKIIRYEKYAGNSRYNKPFYLKNIYSAEQDSSLGLLLKLNHLKKTNNKTKLLKDQIVESIMRLGILEKKIKEIDKNKYIELKKILENSRNQSWYDFAR